jgi:hypothetical protein
MKELKDEELYANAYENIYKSKINLLISAIFWILSIPQFILSAFGVISPFFLLTGMIFLIIGSIFSFRSDNNIKKVKKIIENMNSK